MGLLRQPHTIWTMAEKTAVKSPEDQAREAYARRQKQVDDEHKQRLKQTQWVFVETTHPAKGTINVGSSSMKSGDDRHIGPLGFFELNYREVEKLQGKAHLCRFVLLPEGTTPEDVRIEKISEAVGALAPEKQKEIANKLKAEARAPKEA